MGSNVNGITPSSAKEKTDSIGSVTQKPIDLKQLSTNIEKNRLELEYLKARERFKETEKLKLEEVEKLIAEEKRAIEKELKKQSLSHMVHSMKDSYLWELYLKAKYGNQPFDPQVMLMLEDEILRRRRDWEKSLVPNSMP